MKAIMSIFNLLLVLLFVSNASADTVGNLVLSSGTNERVESAVLNNGGSSSCTVLSQSGNWVSSGTRNSAGYCDWPINSGIFSSAPRCVCTSHGVGADLCYGSSPSNITFWTSSRLGSTSVNADDTVTVICMGPK